MELFNLFELKILLPVFRSSREFLLPPLILAELCLGAYHARPAKRSCFALSSNTSLDELRARLHGGGGHQVGEVTRVDGVKN